MVQIKPLKRFWPAEDYHQDYAEHNKLRYDYYRWACGRDRRLEAVWGARALSLIHISEPTRLRRSPYAVFFLKNKKM